VGVSTGFPSKWCRMSNSLVQSRDQSLRDFREDSSVRVLLMSLKAGGVALNLTVANEAYLMDPWWNPYVYKSDRFRHVIELPLNPWTLTIPYLTCGAPLVFLMNSAAEMQAIDRTHRLGQYRPIRAVRFIAEGTVEERVLQLQEKKRHVFDGTVGR
jgi:DNA repair protein RAD16